MKDDLQREMRTQAEKEMLLVEPYRTCSLCRG